MAKLKNRYTRFWPNIRPWSKKQWPENLISARPVRFLGIFVGVMMELAKPGYKWSNEK